eukprot:CAMPEP_0182898522 /NCGR_PEP_ID=MMETSP0034_2-20130328/27533_1 /TAXON_ID=156128 /ORGANISM="Nephroselmis pyriformis, Strain CCMP717" /LENGTH=286 /DNA_ID=CAMNT_0025032495 /DNA_START=10 /DNA_END=870 /DNA_ORIENTATION=+
MEVITSLKIDETSLFVVFLNIFAVVGCFFVPFDADAAKLLAFSYFFRMFVITAGYHRYFSHRAFKTSRPAQAVLCALCCMAGQRGPVWWASQHRHHHHYSDGPQDTHSPRKGFAWSHMGWFMCSNDYNDVREETVPDLLKFPELKWMDDRHYLFFLGHAAALGLLGFQGWFWAFVVSTAACGQTSYGINSIVHVDTPGSSVRFDTGDDSRNNWWFALLTNGEGWHNNHHAFPNTVRQGLYWYEWDLTYYVLRAMAAVGLVWDLREPNWKVVERRQEASAAALRSKP